MLLSLSDSWRTSLEGFDLVGLFSTHCKLPIGDKLFPVELNPRLEKLHLVQRDTTLCSIVCTSNALCRIAAIFA